MLADLRTRPSRVEEGVDDSGTPHATTRDARRTMRDRRFASGCASAREVVGYAYVVLFPQAGPAYPLHVSLDLCPPRSVARRRPAVLPTCRCVRSFRLPAQMIATSTPPTRARWLLSRALWLTLRHLPGVAYRYGHWSAA